MEMQIFFFFLMNAQNLKMESGAGEWMQTRFSFLFVDEMNQTRQQVVSYINSLWVFNLWWTKNTKMQKQFFFFLFINGKTNANKMNDARIEWTWFRSLSSDTKCCRLEIRDDKMVDGSLMDRPKIWSDGR